MVIDYTHHRLVIRIAMSGDWIWGVRFSYAYCHVLLPSIWQGTLTVTLVTVSTFHASLHPLFCMYLHVVACTPSIALGLLSASLVLPGFLAPTGILKHGEPTRQLNTLRPRQSGRHFADDIFKCIFLIENV